MKETTLVWHRYSEKKPEKDVKYITVGRRILHGSLDAPTLMIAHWNLSQKRWYSMDYYVIELWAEITTPVLGDEVIGVDE